ncbi:late embryogenesis abundant protein [Senna tora]|uniref:Late embryogenesis abundant protein n=1 Tax=Senna tora TaxID=362788 RepID=A0A834SYP3_9FABA|nr:late embryogenesis abundant protein [Senna tora]
MGSTSITPMSSYPITTEELIAMFRPKHKEESSKCVVHILSTLVFLLAVFLLIASILTHLRIPEVELRSPKLMHISCNTTSPSSSSSPSFNVTLLLYLTIKNANFVASVYEEKSSTLSVLYRGTRVGGSEIGHARVKAGETKELKLVVNLRSNRLLDSEILASDLHSRVLKFRIYTKLRGERYMLKVLRKRMTTVMACTVDLNLTSNHVYHFRC